MFVQKFNHRPRHERLGVKSQKPVGPLIGGVVSATIDSDFDELGVSAHPDVVIAPGLVAHFGYSGGALDPALETVSAG